MGTFLAVSSLYHSQTAEWPTVRMNACKMLIEEGNKVNVLFYPMFIYLLKGIVLEGFQALPICPFCKIKM
jgi:hypothetical protein